MFRNCESVVRLLVEFLEHRLPPDVHTDLQRHLAACPRCLSQMRTYCCTVSLLRSIKEEDLPEELRSSLQAFLDKKCKH
jgi:anti-sigma factor (TIGR02949 family)